MSTQIMEKIRILFLSANPWSTGRILVDEEVREISERLQEGPYRDKFELHNHGAVRPIDFQKLLLKYEPQIVHFSGHGSKRQRILFSGTRGRSKAVDQRGLAKVLALYSRHVRLVLLNACFTKAQAQSISEVVNYSIGTGKAIGDKASVAFAGAFYRALAFGKSVREAFESATAELELTKMPRSRGIELFVRDGLDQKDSFPRIVKNRRASRSAININRLTKVEARFECQITILNNHSANCFGLRSRLKSACRRDSLKQRLTPGLVELRLVTAAPCAIKRRNKCLLIKSWNKHN
ncbi:MAG TPA: CHAT domain-containing protein [Pyrinomonadaceae bacterium]|nr:CHAT domain-containing protein [Pyrinomonadaceae bacterium]